MSLRVKLRKHYINNNSILDFQIKLHEQSWNLILKLNDTNDAYDLFLNAFCLLFDEFFPLKEIKTKSETTNNP